VVKWLVRRAAESEATRSPPSEPGHIPEDEAKRRRAATLSPGDIPHGRLAHPHIPDEVFILSEANGFRSRGTAC